MASARRSTFPESGKKKKSKALRVILIIFAVLLIIAGIGVATFFLLKQKGKESLESRDSDIPQLPTQEISGEEPGVNVPEGAIYYNGNYYTYNDGIFTILALGIDNSGEFEEKDYAGTGARADALFLINLDTNNHRMSLIPISRDTITDVDIYSDSMKYVGTDKLQLALAYTYGDGMNKSCELVVKAVKKLFYNIPIHGYAAINLDAIGTLNDMVGGVEVTVLEDLTRLDPSLVKGQNVRLWGKQAQYYVRNRTNIGDGTNESRMARQKQYILSYINAAKQTISSNVTSVVSMYQTISSNLITNFGLDSITYLATAAAECQFDENSIYTIQGENVLGTKLMEFYPDEDAVRQVILDVFYDKVQ